MAKKKILKKKMISSPPTSLEQAPHFRCYRGRGHMLVAFLHTSSRIMSKVYTTKSSRKVFHAEVLTLCLAPVVIVERFHMGIITVHVLFNAGSVEHLLWHVCADRIRSINEKRTLTTYPLACWILPVLFILTDDTFFGLIVPPTRLLAPWSSPLETKKTFFAPRFAPAIADVPIMHAKLLIFAIPHQHNCVVYNIIARTSNDAAAVSKQTIAAIEATRGPTVTSVFIISCASFSL